MKKSLLYLFLLGLTPILAEGQSFSVSDPKIEQGFELDKARLSITNNSGTDKEVMVQRTFKELAPNHVNYFCWVQCYGPETEISPEPLTIPAGGTNSESFYGDLEHYGAVGDSRVCYTFYDKNNVSDKVEQCFNYRIGTGITKFSRDFSESMGGPFPNPAKAVAKVNYDLTGKRYSSAVVQVRNLAGATVKKLRLENTKGEFTLNTENLPAGIYTYSLVIDDKSELTKRLVVIN